MVCQYLTVFHDLTFHLSMLTYFVTHFSGYQAKKNSYFYNLFFADVNITECCQNFFSVSFYTAEIFT